MDYYAENTEKNSSIYNFDKPFMILDYKSELSKCEDNNYTQGCRWSPDGKCILVPLSNKEIKIFNVPSNVLEGNFNDEKWLMGQWRNDIKPAYSYKESEYIYDYSWYPLMNSENETNSCFAVTCKGLPIHLWNSSNGQFVCSYLYFNHLDLLSPAFSVQFSPDGLKLIGGYSKNIQIFDVELPGRTSTSVVAQDHTGIISTISFHPQIRSIFAAGSYSGSLGLYSLQTQKAFAVFEGQKKGITFVKFSSDGTKLFSGTRNDDDIFCWDMRNPGQLLEVYKREKTTSQKFYFDITPQDDRFLISGTRKGQVLVWDLLSPSSEDEQGDIGPTSSFIAHKDCANCISVHPSLPLLATSSGQRSIRHIKDVESSDDSEEETKISVQKEISMKLWWIGNSQ